MAIKREVMASSISGIEGFASQVSGKDFFRQPRGHMMVRVVRGLCTLASILLLAAIPARAQLATAELNGRVTDDSGAVLPGATVTVTQTATGLVRTAVTEANGT